MGICGVTNGVVEWLNSLNGLDYFSNVGSVATTSTTTLGRIPMYPQLSLVGCLISKYNLTMTNCYAIIRYNSTRFRF